MNKVAKGTIAIASAIALFGGGAGSLAYWQVSASTEPLTLGTGYVELRTAVQSAAYTLNGDTVTRTDLESTRLVPGDVVGYSQMFTIDVGGTDAVLRVPELDFGTTEDYLVEAIEADLEVTPFDGYTQFSTTNEARAYNVGGYGGVKIAVTITIPADLEDTEPMLDIIFLEPLALTLTQVTEPLPGPDLIG